MHTVYIHIDEKLDDKELRALESDLREIRYISDVEIDAGKPHDILVEFEEAHISPMAILKELSRHGLHGDIISG
ncbi:MAG: hypothetical protein J5I92_12735 [Thiogranum sp.]|nr:hypothetical protein [Thiogranum sp.]